MTPLTLPENLLLLSLHDERGVTRGSFVNYALAGAALAELILRGNIVRSDEKEGRFQWGDATETGDEYIDVCQAIITEKGIDRRPQHLVSAIGQKPKVSRVLLTKLVEKGILRPMTKKVLFFFTKTVYPEADPSAETELKSRLANAMFRGEEPTPEEAVLIALAHNLSILHHNFDRDLLKEHKARVNEIVKGETLAHTATKAARDAIQAAIMVTAILPGIVAATTASG